MNNVICNCEHCGRELPPQSGRSRPRRFCQAPARCKSLANAAKRTARRRAEADARRAEAEATRAATLPEVVRVVPDYLAIADALVGSPDPDTRAVARAAQAMVAWLAQHADDAGSVGAITVVRGRVGRRVGRDRHGITDGRWAERYDAGLTTRHGRASAYREMLDEEFTPDVYDRRARDHWAR